MTRLSGILGTAGIVSRSFGSALMYRGWRIARGVAGRPIGTEDVEVAMGATLFVGEYFFEISGSAVTLRWIGSRCMLTVFTKSLPSVWERSTGTGRWASSSG